MKKITTIVLFTAALMAAGCGSRTQLNEKQFAAIWQEYLRIEFQESFDGNQSVAQKEKILSGILSEYSIDLDEFKSFMKEKHKDKYNKIFVQ